MNMDNSPTIRSLLNTEIAWVKEIGRPRWLGLLDGEKCELTMGNFPAEALYTLVWRGERIEFDDTPPKWTLPRD
jgi:hypothetical protein